MNNEQRMEIMKIHRKYKSALLMASLDSRSTIRRYYQNAVDKYMDTLLDAYLTADKQFQELALISESAAGIIAEQRKLLEKLRSREINAKTCAPETNADQTLQELLKLLKKEDDAI